MSTDTPEPNTPPYEPPLLERPPSLEAAEHTVTVRVISGAVFILLSAALGVCSLVLFHTGISWYRGDSADPRCVFQRPGWISNHLYDAQQVEHVRCLYYPDMVDRMREATP